MQVPRLLLKNVRSVLRRLKPDRNARLGPSWIVLRAGPQGLAIEAQDAEVALSARLEGSRSPEVIVLPTTALSELEGRPDDVVLEATGTDKVQARWSDGAVPRAVECDSTDLTKLPKFPDVPTSLVSNPPSFLSSLSEAMRTAANEMPGTRSRRSRSGALLVNSSRVMAGRLLSRLASSSGSHRMCWFLA
jgi:hypothetical protein